MLTPDWTAHCGSTEVFEDLNVKSTSLLGIEPKPLPLSKFGASSEQRL